MCWDGSVKHVVGLDSDATLCVEQLSAVGGGCVVVGLATGPAVALRVGVFCVTDAADQLGWAVVVQDRQDAGPVGESEAVGKAACSVAEQCCGCHVLDRSASHNRLVGGAWIGGGDPESAGLVAVGSEGLNVVTAGLVVLGCAIGQVLHRGAVVLPDVCLAVVPDDERRVVGLVEHEYGVREHQVLQWSRLRRSMTTVADGVPGSSRWQVSYAWRLSA